MQTQHIIERKGEIIPLPQIADTAMETVTEVTTITPVMEKHTTAGGRVIYLVTSTSKPIDKSVLKGAKVIRLKQRGVNSVSPFLWIGKLANTIYAESVRIWHSVYFLISN